MILRLAIVGFGNVGQQFAKLLLMKREWLLRQKGLDVEIVAICTKRRGSLMSDRALDIERVLKLLEDGQDLRAYGDCSKEMAPLEVIDKTVADMMIELTTLDIESGQPATTHIEKALEGGMDVVTANKGPIAFAYHDLMTVARSRGVHFRFEGSVMDGTPVFSLVEKTLPGCEVLGIMGILNSTSNFVLTEMSAGRTMDEAVKEAQRRGIAEADPSLDIDGWDASAKIAALANVLMGTRMTPKQVDRTGIRDVVVRGTPQDSSGGAKTKLIAEASREGDEVKLSVKPRTVDQTNPFWSVDGTSSAVTISTDLMGDLTIVESSPALTQTAYAVFSDMLHIIQAIRSGTL